MDTNIVKLDDLRKDVVYKDDKGQFFKIFRVEYSENPRSWVNTFTFFTWEGDNESPDKTDRALQEFAEAHEVNTQKEWSLSTVIDKMNRDGYLALPIYGEMYGCSYYSLDNSGDPWSRTSIGIAFVERSRPGLKGISDKRLKAIAEEEMKEYDAWVQGDVWGIALLSSHNEWLDSSSGYLGTKDWASLLKEMMSAVGILIQDEYKIAKVTTITYLE